ncbi:MAG: hypothetical protein FWD13_12770 [Treponema sp.]|nr:hypothetical protein [Treponema sp.]
MKKLIAVLLTAAVLVIMNACPFPEESFGGRDSSWANNSYNKKYRVFPNAPRDEILTYPWGSGTDNYFDKNAPISYWNTQGHNHKYPDLFHFANGNSVRNIADWELRRQEIFNILQYYMHGRMPPIDPSVLEIDWTDTGNTCEINLKHIDSGRTAVFNLTHNPPAGAVENAKDRIILFGVGQNPTGRDSSWGTAALVTTWAGSESTRAGTCATLYGLSSGASDTPSINMQYSWVMSIILTVIEQGGLNGYYDPEKVGIYGFSRWGKAAMCIGAFAESRDGNQIGFTFIGSAGAGGPSIERWINQLGYLNHTEDPLPVDEAGAMRSTDLKGITWYLQEIENNNGNNGPGSSTGGRIAYEVVRGWTAETPGIPAGSHIYNEYTQGFTRNPGPPESWGQIQTMAQARHETSGWFSERFRQFSDRHSGLRTDRNSTYGLLCTMPFDAYYISALIAPRIIFFEEGYNTMRNNPESQWVNWLICDEVYQMYAKELNDSSIIWRNAIKFYDIPHSRIIQQNGDESDLVNAIYSGTQPNVKFRTPPFPVDDPRYRRDFDRMDWGRPGHPTIAERVRKMRESPVPVKAMDWRGLLDNPEPLN